MSKAILAAVTAEWSPTEAIVQTAKRNVEHTRTTLRKLAAKGLIEKRRRRVKRGIFTSYISEWRKP